MSATPVNRRKRAEALAVDKPTALVEHVQAPVLGHPGLAQLDGVE